MEFLSYTILTAILCAVGWFCACALGRYQGYRRALERWERAQRRRRQAAFGSEDDGALNGDA